MKNIIQQTGYAMTCCLALCFSATSFGIDDETFEEFCSNFSDQNTSPDIESDPSDTNAVCSGGGVISLLQIDRTSFGTSLTPNSNNAAATLVNSANTTSRKTIGARLESQRSEGEGSTYYKRTKDSSSEGISFATQGKDILGGGASADNNLVKQWGLFGTVKYSDGERENVAINTNEIGGGDIAGGVTELGFDYDNINASIGLDYRSNPNLILGVLGTYSRGEAVSIADTSTTEYDEYTASIFGSYYTTSGLYVDGIFGVGLGENEYQRDFSFSTETTILSEVADIDYITMAEAGADTNSYSSSLGIGYSGYSGAWTFNPYLQLNWLETEIDAYREISEDLSFSTKNIVQLDGAEDNLLLVGQAITDDFLLDTNKQELFSLTSVLGIGVARAFNAEWGVFTPKLSISWIRQFEDEAGITSQFRAATDNGINGVDFDTDIPELDDSYFDIGVGITATLRNDLVSFLYIDSILGHDDIGQTSINFGLRKEY